MATEKLLKLSQVAIIKQDSDDSYLGKHATADAAAKLSSDAGSATQPVYFDNGVPVATTYSLAKSVPADAEFTDTTYSDVTADETGAADSGLMTSADKYKLDGVTAGAQPNVIESVKVNGTALAPENKAVDVLIAEGSVDKAISVNGSPVAVHGLGSASTEDVAASIADGGTGLATSDQVYDHVASAIATAIATTYKPAGSIAPASVAAALLIAANEGKVYNLSGALTIDATTAALFIDGTAGESFPEGTNIVVVDDEGSYKFDVLAGFVDLSPYLLAADVTYATDAEVRAALGQSGE
ncbi:MAG: hypothetical protein IJ111_01170 [Eggerthellaceae bacterium]|nr:hypothetical protein [Eggerthellaceae bacterium]